MFFSKFTKVKMTRLKILGRETLVNEIGFEVCEIDMTSVKPTEKRVIGFIRTTRNWNLMKLNSTITVFVLWRN